MMVRKAGLVCVLVAVGSLFVGGCASGATAQGMTVTPGEVASPTPSEMAKSLVVDEGVGGRETNAMDASKIDNKSFKAALVSSLLTAGLLGEGPGARYKVAATLLQLEQPMGGIDMTVTSKIRYTVTDTKKGVVVFEEEVVASHTAHLGDAAIGTTRLRIATERSARKSIVTLIEKLKKAKLPTSEVALASTSI